MTPLKSIFSSRAFCSTVSGRAPVSNRMRRPSASTSAEKPHSPTPYRSVSIVERITTSTALTGPRASCAGAAAGTIMVSSETTNVIKMSNLR